MCDIDCANLIDLSLEENNAPQKTDEHTLIPSSSESLLQQQGLLHFVSPPRKERHSLDNNPFDCVQKLANCQDDPFDIVEREACFKARLCAKPLVEVKLGNLLSLSDENLASTNYMETGNDGCKNKLKNFDLESESPPVTMIEKITVDGMDSNSGTDTDSTPGNSAELSSTSKLKKSMEYRKRLLKLSVANSAAFNSPVARRSSLDEGSDTMGTPVASTLMKSTFLCEYSLAAESPLKFVDDDIMSEEPPPSLDAEKNFEADLEMLKIPMLSELQSPLTQNMSPVLGEKSDVSDHENNTPINKSKILDLEAIKTRLKARREETNNNNDNNSHQQDINSLICDLKSLINCGDMINSGKQMQVSSLLESLSSALNTSQTEDSRIQSPPQICPSVQPQTIKRQGTFDMELQETNKSDDDLAKQPLVSEMPNCMVSSSATYDGETAEDKQDLNLPEIDPPSPQSSNCGEPNEITLQHDVNDIVEQLSKLLIHNNSADGNQTVQPNPTFIVVMNTTPMPQHNNSVSVIAPTARQNAAMMSSYIENSSLDDSPELHSSTTATRRRSQSLSLHDKVKIVQLPLQPPTPKTLQRQHSMTMDDSSSVTTTPPPKDMATTDFKTPEFKTPARMVRRNSYSSGTPYTVTVGLRRTGTRYDLKMLCIETKVILKRFISDIS